MLLAPLHRPVTTQDPNQKSHSSSSVTRAPSTYTPDGLSYLTTTTIALTVLSVSTFFTLPYPILKNNSSSFDSNPVVEAYGKGPQDIPLVILIAATFLLIRSSVSQSILLSLAKKWNVAPNRIPSFVEQSWLLVCHILSLSFGLTVLSKTTYQFDTTQFWIGYPHQHLTASEKGYYIFAMGYWCHHLVGVHLGPKRGDHTKMVAHHFVTVALLLSSVSFFSSFDFFLFFVCW